MTEQVDIQLLTTIVSIFVFILGAMVGSFLNVCVHRIPRGLSVVRPRSRCPKCENPIAWYDNVPVVSWLVLGAKCRNCGEPISWQYPLVEAINATLFLGVFLKFGFTLASPIYMLFCAGLVLVTFVDLTDWTIPDEVSLPGIPLGVAVTLIAMFYPKSGLLLDNVFMSLAGVLLGGGSLYLLDKVALLLLKKRGMGFGDVKLLAMMGAFFGPVGVFVIIMLAAVVGSFFGVAMIVAQRGKEQAETSHYLPFGPYLALAGLVYLFIGPELVEAYLNALTPGSGGASSVLG